MTARTEGITLSRLIGARKPALGALSLVSGKAGSGAVALALAPIIARIFEPGHFGTAATVIAVTMTIGSVAALRYDLAVVLPKDERVARTLIDVGLASIAATTLLAALAVMGLAVIPWGAGLRDRYGEIAWIVPVGAAALGAVSLMEAWLIRRERYQSVASAEFGGTLFSGGTRVAAGGVLGSSVGVLLATYLGGVLIRLLMLQRGARGTLKGHTGDLSDVVAHARSYRDFPMLNTPSGLLFGLSRNIPLFGFGFLFGVEVAGLYAMAARLAESPTNMVVTSIRRVYMRSAAKKKEKGGSLLAAAVRTTARLTLVTLPALVVVLLWGESLVVTILGDRWAASGLFVVLLAPWLFVKLVSTPFSASFVVARQQGTWLKLQIASMAVRAALIAAAWWFHFDQNEALALFVGGSILLNLVIVAVAVGFLRRLDEGSLSLSTQNR